jgi:uncharacterized membrane protein YGL010W
MRPLVEHLASYAAYHRDPRNIATHWVGIPMIVAAILILLSRPMFELGGVVLTPAWCLALLFLVAYYIPLHWGLGLVFAVVFGVGCAVGQRVAEQPTVVWLGWGIGLFVVGWVLQFVGHFFEGRKPAFADDLIGLLQGPLFLLAEALFVLGWRRDLHAEIVRRHGPVRKRQSVSASA